MQKLRWGLIGCGDIARKRVVRALSELPFCELVVVCDKSAEISEPFAKEFGIGRWTENWMDLVSDREIDAVYIATPHYLHADQTVAAAECGKHVLCEKTMSINSQECARMIRACETAGVKLGVAFYRHFYPVIHRIKQILASGELGKTVLVQINSFTRYDMKPGEPKYWMFEKEKSGGGPMISGGCHRLEIFMNLLGPIANTVSVLDNVVVERTVEDTGVAVFRFESGPLAVLSMSQSIRESNDTFYLYGSEGSIHAPALGTGEIIIRKGPKGVDESRESHPPHSNSHLPMIDSYCRSVLKGEDPVVDGKLGLEVQKVMDAIYA